MRSPARIAALVAALGTPAAADVIEYRPDGTTVEHLVERASPFEPISIGPATGLSRRITGYREEAERAGARHGVDPDLVLAVIQAESAGDRRAVSPKGAQGLMQLMPATAARFGVADAFDPLQNIDGGTGYLAWLLARFDGDLALALAGYNAGEGKVDRHGGVPPYRETRGYLARISRLLGQDVTRPAPVRLVAEEPASDAPARLRAEEPEESAPAASAAEPAFVFDFRGDALRPIAPLARAEEES